MKEYKKALKDHLKEVKDVELPESGKVVVTYDINTKKVTAMVHPAVQTRGDEGNSGYPIP